MVAVVQPRSRQVSASICAGWQAAAQAACDLAYSGKYAEARASAERLLVTIEEALGPEAEELLVPLEVLNYTTRRALLVPLEVLNYTTRRAGQLDDSYTIMLRTLNISEKHHGEEGMVTCRLRTDIGNLVLYLPNSLSLYLLCPSPVQLKTSSSRASICGGRLT